MKQTNCKKGLENALPNTIYLQFSTNLLILFITFYSIKIKIYAKRCEALAVLVDPLKIH
ncbi:hypothetical protein JCM17380_38760 [Desulfosporosinus burensis]